MTLSSYLLEAVVTLASVSALYSKYALTVAKKREAHVKKASEELESKKELQARNEDLRRQISTLEGSKATSEPEVLVPGTTVLCNLGGNGHQYTRGVLRKLTRKSGEMSWAVQVGDEEIVFSCGDIKLAPAQADTSYRELGR